MPLPVQVKLCWSDSRLRHGCRAADNCSLLMLGMTLRVFPLPDGARVAISITRPFLNLYSRASTRHRPYYGCAGACQVNSSIVGAMPCARPGGRSCVALFVSFSSRVFQLMRIRIIHYTVA